MNYIKNKFLYKTKILYDDRIDMKEMMLIQQANQKSAIFVIIATFQMKDLSSNYMYAIDAMIY